MTAKEKKSGQPAADKVKTAKADAPDSPGEETDLVAALEEARRKLQESLVLVHGAAKQITEDGIRWLIQNQDDVFLIQATE